MFREHVYECTAGVSGAHKIQKKALDSPGPGVRVCCKPACAFEESNLGPLQEQQVVFFVCVVFCFCFFIKKFFD